MSWLTFWKFLHIACMFVAVGLFVGGGILNNRVQQSRDVRAIRTVIAAESRIAPVAGVLMVLGIIFGFATAVAGGFDLLAPWLLVTYGLVLVIILIGALYHGPHDKNLEEAATESGEAQPSDELLTLITRYHGTAHRQRRRRSSLGGACLCHGGQTLRARLTDTPAKPKWHADGRSGLECLARIRMDHQPRGVNRFEGGARYPLELTQQVVVPALVRCSRDVPR